MNTGTTEKESQWHKTPVANLDRNASSGIYYASVRVRGKLIWKTLKTDRMSVAKLRLGDFLKEENHRAEVYQASSRGKMTFGAALGIYELLDLNGVARRIGRNSSSTAHLQNG